MSDAELKEVIAEISGEGADEFEASEIILTCSVNSLPSCVIKGARADNAGRLMTATAGAEKYSLQATSEKLSDDQNDMFKPSGERELIVDLEVIAKHGGGDSSSLRFEGLSSAPGMNLTTGKVLEQKSVVHRDLRMAGMNLSIYELLDEYGNAENKPSLDIGSNEPVATMLDKLVNWTLGGDFQTHGKDVALASYLEETHAGNLAIYSDIVGPILKGSTETKLEVFGKARYRTHAFEGGITGILHAQSDFLQCLMGSVLSTFVFQLVCNFDTPMGGTRIRHSQTHAKPEEKVELDIISLNSGMGGTGELPLGQIIVSGSRLAEYAGPTPGGVGQTPGSTSKSIAVQGGWPKNKTPIQGQTKFIATPRWMEQGYSSGTSVEIKPAINGDPKDRVVQPDVDKSLQKLDDNLKKPFKPDGVLFVLNAWAQKHYIEQALQNHTCVVEIPLDLDWGTTKKPVGQVYDVSASPSEDEGAVKLFDGYLRSVVHSVGVGNKQGRAITSLTFTHVKGSNWGATNMDPPYGHSLVPSWVKG